MMQYSGLDYELLHVSCYCMCVYRLVYVVTVDGKVTVISEHGQIQWEYHTGAPLFHSTLNQKASPVLVELACS